MKKIISNKTFLIFISVLAILFLFIFVYYLDKNSKGTLDIETTPKDVQYKIDKELFTGSNKIEVDTGEISIKFERDYFLPKTIKTVVTKGGSTKLEVTLELDPNKKDRGLQGVTDALYDQAVQKAVDENPLIKLLPYITNDFRIDYGFDVENKYQAIYEITLFNPTSKEAETALKTRVSSWFKSKGYDLNSLKHTWFTE
jgi:hypothetical protein